MIIRPADPTALAAAQRPRGSRAILAGDIHAGRVRGAGERGGVIVLSRLAQGERDVEVRGHGDLVGAGVPTWRWCCACIFAATLVFRPALRFHGRASRAQDNLRRRGRGLSEGESPEGAGPGVSEGGSSGRGRTIVGRARGRLVSLGRWRI